MLLIVLCLFCTAKAQAEVYDGLYLGVGVGVIIIAIAIVVGIIFCFMRTCTNLPELFCLIGFAVPLIVFAIVYLSPKDVKTVTTEIGDYYTLRMAIYIVLMVIFLLVALFAYCYDFYGVRVFGTRVESAKRNAPKAGALDKTMTATKPVAAAEEKKEEVKKEQPEEVKKSEGDKSPVEDRKPESEKTPLKLGA